MQRTYGAAVFQGDIIMTPSVPETHTPTTPADQGQRLRMSYAEYLAWAHEDIHAEWVNGEVIVHMPPKTTAPNCCGLSAPIAGPVY